jgi:drug/metabolite transporter (DMT)-like permease
MFRISYETFMRISRQAVYFSGIESPMSTVPRRTTLTLGLLAGVAAVSTASIFIKLAQQGGAPSLVIAAVRLSLATLGLAPLALTRCRPALRALTRREWTLALLSGLFLALHFAVWITSLEYTSVASSVVLVTTTSLWVALLSPLVLHERVEAATFVGLGLAMTGGAVVGLSDACTWQPGAVTCPPLHTFFAGTAFLGDFLALCGAWMAAGYMLVGRKLRARMDLIPYIFIVYGMAALVLVLVMLAFHQSPFGYTPAIYLWLVLLALVPQLLGHSTFNWALKHMPASFVSVTLLGEPVGSTILAYFIFQEEPGWVKIGGALLILAGIWLASRMERSQLPTISDETVTTSLGPD